jgi:membrane protease subunit HflK
LTAGKVRLIAILILVGIAVIIGLSGIYVVNPGEQAVVLTFGRNTDTTDSGIHFRIPMVQQVHKLSTTQQHTLEYGYRTTQAATTTSTAKYEDHPEESIMLTSDQNIVSVEAVFQYYVTDAAEYLYNVDDQEGTLRCAFETVLRRNLQNRTLDDALLNKLEIADQVLPDFREILKPYGLGVTVKAVMIQNITVPQEVQSAYEDVNNALTEKTKNLDEAEKYKNQVVPNAEAQAYKMVQEAQAYSAKTIASAQGEVAQFNDVYAKYVDNKEITRKRLLIEALESILSNADKLYMVDDNTGMLKLLSLDNSSAPSSLQPQATAAPMPTVAPQTTATAGGN